MPLKFSSIAAAFLLSLVIAACGGDDDGNTAGAPSAGGDTVATTAEDAEAPDREESASDRGKRSERGTQGSAAAGGDQPGGAAGKRPTALPKTFKEALQRVSAARRQRLLTRALAPVIKVAGIRGAQFAMSADFRALTVDVPPSQACRANTKDAGVIQKGVKQILRFVESVTVVVGGAPYTSWISSNCARDELEGGHGVVFRRSGFGVAETRPFRVATNRFVIEYSHQGDFFSVFVRRGKKHLPNPINSDSPGSGRQAYPGPGTFRLEIAGSGDWTVRVRAVR